MTSENKEKAEDRKIGQIIMAGLAALALILGLIVICNSKASNVADPRYTSTTSNPTK